MRPTVLVVDDEVDLLATYHRLLDREGYRVIRASSRTTALAAVERERPGLVIAALRLHDGSGSDVIRAARALDPPASAILVTRLGGAVSHRAAEEVRASLLIKPFLTAAFLNLVRAQVPILALDEQGAARHR
jgi:DNA-binding response OmpR family regulator